MATRVAGVGALPGRPGADRDAEWLIQVTAWRIISLEDERASVSGGASQDLELTG